MPPSRVLSNQIYDIISNHKLRKRKETLQITFTIICYLLPSQKTIHSFYTIVIIEFAYLEILDKIDCTGSLI